MNNWYCYILHSTTKNNITYNGATNNPIRRLRQHNGEIKGGAKATSKNRPHQIYCLITGFNNKKEALRCEWRIKHPTNQRRRPYEYCGIDGRIKGLNLILQDTKFTSNSELDIKDMNLTIWIIKDKSHLLVDIPMNINLVIVDKIDINELLS